MKAKMIDTPEIDTTPSEIHALESSIDSEIYFYKELLKKFEAKHGKLEKFEKELSEAEIAEHPNWEESIEWRNACEELNSLKLIKGVLHWTSKFLKQQRTFSKSAS